MKKFFKVLLIIIIFIVLIVLFNERGSNLGDITIVNDFSDQIFNDDEEDVDDVEENIDQGTEEDDDPIGVNVQDPLEPEGVKATTFRYTEEGFDFDSHIIKVGGSVFFTNITDNKLNLASDAHPTHENYPALNVGDINNGEFIEVQFTALGEFGFHNHNNASQKGVVIVVEEF
jgi:plastocyanin